MVKLTADTLSVADDLLRYGEDATAVWVESCTDDEFVRVCNAAIFVESYGPTTPAGNGMTLSKACAIGAVYVHEGTPRALARGRRDNRRTLPVRPRWARRWTNSGLQDCFDEFYGVGDDFVAFWATSPDAMRERIAKDRASFRERPRQPLPSEPTHVTAYGDDLYELNDWARPFVEQWNWILGRMDGGDNGVFATWPLPPGKRLGEFDPADYESGYLQSAGSADRLAVEVRYLDDDGGHRQYAVGKQGLPPTDGPSESITFGDNSVVVCANEVFTADEAAPIYEAYRLSGRVPDGFTLRLLDL